MEEQNSFWFGENVPTSGSRAKMNKCGVFEIVRRIEAGEISRRIVINGGDGQFLSGEKVSVAVSEIA